MTRRATVWLSVLSTLALTACDPPPVVINTPDALQDAAPDAIDVPDPNPEPIDEDTPEPEDLPPQPECSAVEFRGEVIDCRTFDFCPPFGPDNLTAALACCECDPSLCNPSYAPCACGDGFCDVAAGEDYQSCPLDCPEPINPDPVESCMSCHNGAPVANNYAGPGLSNPHPFEPAGALKCTTCHGGRGDGAGKRFSHVPAPPEIGDRAQWAVDPAAWFRRLTLAGLDTVGERDPDDPYEVDERPGEQFTNLDYVQFVNPGDLRVVSAGRSCGANGCHRDEHATWVPRSVIATSAGIFGGARFAAGIENRIQAYRGIDGDSLADTAPTGVENPDYDPERREIGEVGQILTQPELAGWQGIMRQNAAYDAETLPNHIVNADQDPERPNRVRYNSPLEHLIDAQTSITCGNCHLGTAGNNDRFADYRSSGCTACHMEYTYDGRSRSDDPNVLSNEPADPDNIAPGERPHIESHQIRNVARSLPGGGFVRGISDRACVGCHQGSNRTVLQFWGVRLDQNRDVAEGTQYPTNPIQANDGAQDERLFQPAIGNQTFNGRTADQYVTFEDYDGDGRDDTPPDIHAERGMGCIDCHGSGDLHGSAPGDDPSGRIRSRQSQSVAITCESCHGGIDAHAQTEACIPYGADDTTDCASDSRGRALRHVTRDAQGQFWLISRVDGSRHFVPQTLDTIVDSGKVHPFTQRAIYSPKASYAMGRADGNVQTGIGPQQTERIPAGFAHTDTVSCGACHAAWANTCIGCHLATRHDDNNDALAFSNLTGERILLFEDDASFVYQSPVPFYLGVGPRGKIAPLGTSEKVFYRHTDRNGVESAIMAFGDRLGEGHNAGAGGRSAFPALSQNPVAAHAIRGRVEADKEGPRYCVACHLNEDQMTNHGDDYRAFFTAYQNGDLANIDTQAQATHIGANTGNQNNSPWFVHMAAGLGSGLFWFDAEGCPVNAVDERDDRPGCADGAPALNFDPARVVYDLDRIVEPTGTPNASTGQPRLDGGIGAPRTGATNPNMAGPLGAGVIRKLANPDLGVILDAWLDADGDVGGDAGLYLMR